MELKFKYHWGLVCLKCKEVLFSWYRHHYNKCSCKNKSFVDGGTDYFRIGALDLKHVMKVRLKIKEIK